MRLFPQTELDIGINETRSNFQRRLEQQQRNWMTLVKAQREAMFQSIYRDIQMATTVNELKPVLLELLQEVIT